ncbi:TPA: hypothetical protein KEW13_001789 [Proteus mirabilis]|nr:hypothetical protein [Proteus mirabilis]
MEGLKLLEPLITSDTYGKDEGGDIQLFNTVVLRLLKANSDITEAVVKEYLLSAKGNDEYWGPIAEKLSVKYGAIRDFYLYLNK